MQFARPLSQERVPVYIWHRLCDQPNSRRPLPVGGGGPSGHLGGRGRITGISAGVARPFRASPTANPVGTTKGVVSVISRGLAVLCLAVVLLVGLPVAGALACAGADAQPGSVSKRAYTRAIECLVNEQRAGAGLGALSHDRR